VGGAETPGVDTDDPAGYSSLFRTSFVPIRKENMKTIAFAVARARVEFNEDPILRSKGPLFPFDVWLVRKVAPSALRVA
jgi:hypothetical protein